MHRVGSIINRIGLKNKMIKKTIIFLLLFFNLAYLEDIENHSFFPKGVKIGYVLDLKKVFGKNFNEKFLFDVNSKGKLICIIKNTFFIFTDKENDIVISFKVKNINDISDFVVLEDDSLVVISNKKLIYFTLKYSKEILDLSSYEDIRIKKASKKRFYIFAKNIKDLTYEVYVVYENGVILKLFKTPQRIIDVSGDGDLTFLAINNQIFALLWGEKLKPIYEVDKTIYSIEFSELLNGIFYSTEEEIGYIDKKYKGYTFVKGTKGIIRLRGKRMYIYFNENNQILLCEPISQFKVLTKRLEKLYKNSK